MVVRQRADVMDFPMDHPDLLDGWWDVEHTDHGPSRWTDGNAVLPSMRSSVIEVQLAARMKFPLQCYRSSRHEAATVRLKRW